jgi:hypothetical protein
LSEYRALAPTLCSALPVFKPGFAGTKAGYGNQRQTGGRILRKNLTYMNERFFTIEEARALLPELRLLIANANWELDDRAIKLQELNNRYLRAEKALDECQMPDETDETTLKEFRRQRAEFELAISNLSREQCEFIRTMERWVDKITAHGVILRKMKEGVVDFPARNGEFRYFLSWQHNEKDITHWHLSGDGVIGRKALATLSEYC